jgi:hypothetical protein
MYLISTIVCQMSTLYCGKKGGVRTHTDTHAHAPKIEHYMTRLELTTTKLATNKAICLKTKKINKSKMYRHNYILGWRTYKTDGLTVRAIPLT